MKAKWLVLLLAATAIVSVWFWVQSGARRERPSVLMITLDTTRLDHLSCYGYFRDTSPNIDRLGKRGAVFLKHYSQSNSTLPSHISIFTSLYTVAHDVRIPIRDRLDPGIKTIAEVFRENGYKTAFIGQGTPHTNPESGFQRGFYLCQLQGLLR